MWAYTGGFSIEFDLHPVRIQRGLGQILVMGEKDETEVLGTLLPYVRLFVELPATREGLFSIGWLLIVSLGAFFVSLPTSLGSFRVS